MIKALDINLNIKHIITDQQAWHYHIVPQSITETELILYIDNEYLSPNVKEELELTLNKTITLAATWQQANPIPPLLVFSHR